MEAHRKSSSNPQLVSPQDVTLGPTGLSLVARILTLAYDLPGHLRGRTKRDGLLSLGIRRGLSFTFQFFPAVTNDFLFQDLVYLMGLDSGINRGPPLRILGPRPPSYTLQSMGQD